MRRRALLAGLAGGAACSRDHRLRLNVFNWSSYTAPGTISEFEREFGVRVRYSVYESNEEMLARVMSGNSGWDVVFPSNSLIRPMREMNLLAPLSRELLPNLAHLDVVFRRPAWDPELEWTVPFMWGATGIAFSRSVSPAPAAWADLWEERFRGRITMCDDPAEVIGACLKKLGYSLNSSNARELQEARAEAIKQKPLLRAYVNAEVRDQLVAGDVLAAQMWATIAQQAIDASPAIGFVYPREGFLLYMDCAAVLRESRRRQLAHQFINYLLRPSVAAAISQHARTATANSAGDRGNRILYPDAETMARGEWTGSYSPEVQRLRDRIWTEIKSA